MGKYQNSRYKHLCLIVHGRSGSRMDAKTLAINETLFYVNTVQVDSIREGIKVLKQQALYKADRKFRLIILHGIDIEALLYEMRESVICSYSI